MMILSQTLLVQCKQPVLSLHDFWRAQSRVGLLAPQTVFVGASIPIRTLWDRGTSIMV